MKWLPIETAPRDGTYILAYPVLLDIACVISWDGAGYWRMPMTSIEPPYQPKMWAPLPSPETTRHPALRTRNPLPSGVADPSGRRPANDPNSGFEPGTR